MKKREIVAEVVPDTQFAVKLLESMDRVGLSIRDLSSELSMTYEYTRRLVRGYNLPSHSCLTLLSMWFGWSLEEIRRMVVQDKFRLRNGPEGAIAQAFNPEVEPFERSWQLLEQAQKSILLAQLEMFIAQNRRHVRGGLITNESTDRVEKIVIVKKK
jgi:hypothetical protein